MVNRRYVVVILDSAGRSVRRVTVARTALQLAATGLAVATALFLSALAHGLWVADRAVEARLLARQNSELRALVQRMEERRPHLRTLDLFCELTFAQMWAKSGLGLEPRLLSVGPVEATVGGDPAIPKGSDALGLLHADPLSLPLEVDRLEEEGIALQGALGDTLEYFHDAQLLLANTPSIRPTDTPWLTSSFGRRRDPIFGNWVMHKGLDMGGRIGMEVWAPADGVVIWTGRRGGYGITVVLDHGYGLQTHFAHLSHYTVRSGDRVRRGEPIALMGSTGKSTGPHLHYEVRRNGQPLDPRRFILN